MIPLGVLAGSRYVAPSELTVDFLSFHVDPGKWDSYTFADVPLGAAAADRTIVVAVHTRNIGLSVGSVSVGGIEATIDAQATDDHITGLAHALVPAGTAGDITVYFAGGQTPTRAAIGVWRITGGAVSVLDTASADTGGGPLTVSGAAGAVLLTASTVYGSVATWSGATEDYDGPIEVLGVSGARTTLAAPGDVSPACTWATALGPPATVAVVYGAA